MTVLPEALKCREFVNADKIAKGISPFKPEDVAITAGKIMLERIDQLMKQSVSFAIETTLATRTYRTLVERAKRCAYSVMLLFFWLPSPEVAEQRVAQRVVDGGHDIPRDVIHRRYWSGLRNLFDIFVPIVDLWSLYDNSLKPKPIVVCNEVIDNVKLSTIKQSCQIRKD